MTEIGSTLIRLRREKGLCQKELSTHLELSSGTISNYENDVHLPDLNTLNRLADYFEVTTDYILGRTDRRCSSETMAHYLEGTPEASEIINILLSLDPDSQNTALSYLSFLADGSGNRHKGAIRKRAPKPQQKEN